MKSVLRAMVAFAGTWGLLHGLGRFVRWSPDLPLWLVAAVAAAAVEVILFQYRTEAAAQTRGRARLMIGLRMVTLAMLAWISLDPVLVRTIERDRHRELVVLLDDSASMHLTDEGAATSRLDLGRRALEESGLLGKFEGRLNVRTLHAARSTRVGGEGGTPEGWADATDLAAALSTVLEQVPPDDLAGVVMVSDGRHNRPGRVEDAARRFGILDAPVGIVAVGSPVPPRDVAVVEVKAPDAIHLGDRMRVVATVKYDGYRGKTSRVRLMRGEDTVEERQVTVPQDYHREEIRFSTVPEEGGVGGFRIRVDPLDGERFAENNEWEFETSITDARTNVLIVEGAPRWEFRYLRNLFYGRDKSVHLQYVLLHPDRIEGQADNALPASAGRPFGEARATRLPESEAEWRKFDVILLGDIAPDALDAEQWRILSSCVEERGALLVMIAGPRYMPHALQGDVARTLVPAEMELGSRTYYSVDEPPFRIALTAEGRTHPVVQQSSGETSNEAVWSNFPEIPWRHPVSAVKEGAEVLLTVSDGTGAFSPASGGDLTAALDDLAKRREREAAAALLVTRQTGKGKVALLLTDRTWRLREGAGDVYHHRFWGNLVRWGAGPVLRAGGTRVRLGTDQLTYTPDDRIRVTARLREEDLSPVTDASLKAELLKDGQVVSSVALAPVAGSEGLHEAEFPAVSQSGRYEVKLAGTEVSRLTGEEGGGDVSAGFRVVGSRGPVELADVTLDRPLLETVASLSGGKVVEPSAAGELASLFLREEEARYEKRETKLWDNAWVLGLLALALGLEWGIRRGGGLP